MKKIFCLILCAVSLFLFASCNGQIEPDKPEEQTTAAEVPVPGESQNYHYDEYSDHIVLTKYIGNQKSVTLPTEINDKPITSFGTIFRSSLTLTSVKIPAGSSYTSIAENAFSECNNLTSVTIYDNNPALTKIESNAFFGCQVLNTIIIPATVTEIAEDAFKYCTDLVIYGTAGSAAEEFATKYSSIYFRDKNSETQPAATTVAEPSSTVQATTVKETTTEKETVIPEETTVSQETTQPVSETKPE